MSERNMVTSLQAQEKLLQRVKIFILHINALEKNGLKFQFDLISERNVYWRTAVDHSLKLWILYHFWSVAFHRLHPIYKSSAPQGSLASSSSSSGCLYLL